MRWLVRALLRPVFAVWRIVHRVYVALRGLYREVRYEVDNVLWNWLGATGRAVALALIAFVALHGLVVLAESFASPPQWWLGADAVALPLLFPVAVWWVARRQAQAQRFMLAGAGFAVWAWGAWLYGAPRWHDFASAPKFLHKIGVVDPIVFASIVSGLFALAFVLKWAIRGDEPFERGDGSLGNARYMPLRQQRREFPSDGFIVVGEAYAPSAMPWLKPYDGKNPLTWGRGGRAPILASNLKEGNLCIAFGGSGSGKTAAHAIPTLLRTPGSVIVFDAARDISEQVVPVRSQQMVRVWNETKKSFEYVKRRSIVVDPRRPDVKGVDCLGLLKQMPYHEQEQVLGSYVKLILLEKPEGQGGNDAFFEGNAYGLTAGLLMFLLYGVVRNKAGEKVTTRTLAELRRYMALPESDLKKFCGSVQSALDGDDDGFVFHPQAREFVQRSLAAFVSMSQETWTGIAATVSNETRWLDSERLRACVTGDDYKLEDLHQGGLDIYLVFPAEVLATNIGVVRMLVGMYLQSKLADRGEADRAPLLFLLDETSLLGPMKALKEARDRGRKHGIALALLYQSWSQVVEQWSDKGAGAWIDNASLTLHFLVQDVENSERISKMIGDVTVKVGGTSDSDKWMLGLSPQAAQTTVSMSQQKRPLLLPHEIRLMRGDELIVMPRNREAFVCGKAFYFRRPEMMAGLGVSSLRGGPKGPTPGKQGVDTAAPAKKAGPDLAALGKPVTSGPVFAAVAALSGAQVTPVAREDAAAEGSSAPASAGGAPAPEIVKPVTAAAATIVTPPTTGGLIDLLLMMKQDPVGTTDALQRLMSLAERQSADVVKAAIVAAPLKAADGLTLVDVPPPREEGERVPVDLPEPKIPSGFEITPVDPPEEVGQQLVSDLVIVPIEPPLEEGAREEPPYTVVPVEPPKEIGEREVPLKDRSKANGAVASADAAERPRRLRVLRDRSAGADDAGARRRG